MYLLAIENFPIWMACIDFEMVTFLRPEIQMSLGESYELQLPLRQTFQNWIHYFVSVPALTPNQYFLVLPISSFTSDITQHPDIQAKLSLVYHHSQYVHLISDQALWISLLKSLLNSKLCTSLRSLYLLKAFIISQIFSVISFSCF